ncbi:hypothetical protein J6590_102790, partial [Homalodisca vitripennis]
LQKCRSAVGSECLGNCSALLLIPTLETSINTRTYLCSSQPPADKKNRSYLNKCRSAVGSECLSNCITNPNTEDIYRHLEMCSSQSFTDK